MPEPIYRRPADYDLEHEGDTEDVAFFVALARRLKPSRVLELACGSGRVALPLAEAGAAGGFHVVGLELVPEMLAEARRKAGELPARARKRLTLVAGDMRTWRADAPFDLILSPGSSMCHLLTLDDQLAAWRCAAGNLATGGRFVVDVPMPQAAAYAESFQTPPRMLVELDRDTADSETGARLLRYRAVRYLPHEQRARVHYLYDRFEPGSPSDRYVSDYESHIYYPRELQLLYLHTGFEVEEVFGGYRGRPLGARSEHMIMVGKKP